MSGPLIQNFSIVAGDSETLNFDVDPDDGVTLVGSQIYWRVYDQDAGIATGQPVLEKSLDDGIEATDASALQFAVTIDPADTQDLAHSYYHEAKIIDADGNAVTVTCGIMTVTPSAIGVIAP